MPNQNQEHAIQKVTFGGEGKLWVLVGEGSISTGTQQNAFRVQDIDTLLGKLLRINSDGNGVADNPCLAREPRVHFDLEVDSASISRTRHHWFRRHSGLSL